MSEFKNLTPIIIKADVKKQAFFFYDRTFIFCTPEGQKNKICFFDDTITNLAREYADKNCPEIEFPDIIYTTKKTINDYVRKTKVDYWSQLFHMFIWQYLGKNNHIEYMKKPTC